MQITVTAQLISAFAFLNQNFMLLAIFCGVCVGPGRKPQRPIFAQQDAYVLQKDTFKI